MWWARDDLPDRIATHWGISGEADSFSTVGQAVLFPLIAAPLQLVLLLGIGVGVRQTRMMAHFAAGLSGFLVVIGFGTILAQRGSTDGGGGRIDLVLALSLATGLAMAALTRVLLGAPDPLARTTEPLPASAPRLEGPTATAGAWTGAIRLRGSARWIPLIVTGAIAPRTVNTLIASQRGTAPPTASQ